MRQVDEGERGITGRCCLNYTCLHQSQMNNDKRIGRTHTHTHTHTFTLHKTNELCVSEESSRGTSQSYPPPVCRQHKVEQLHSLTHTHTHAHTHTHTHTHTS